MISVEFQFGNIVWEERFETIFCIWFISLKWYCRESVYNMTTWCLFCYLWNFVGEILLIDRLREKVPSDRVGVGEEILEFIELWFNLSETCQPKCCCGELWHKISSLVNITKIRKFLSYNWLQSFFLFPQKYIYQIRSSEVGMFAL